MIKHVDGDAREEDDGEKEKVDVMQERPNSVWMNSVSNSDIAARRSDVDSPDILPAISRDNLQPAREALA